jgi:integrase
MMRWPIQSETSGLTKTGVPRFANLKDWFGKHPAEELTPKEIENKLASMAEKEKWTPSAFNHYRSLVSLSYRLGILNRKVTANPARSLTQSGGQQSSSIPDRRRGKKPSKSRGREVAGPLPELNLAINTGLRNLRKGSQYGLTWDMVDWKSRELHIPRTQNEEPLHVPLNDAAISALKTVSRGGMEKDVSLRR